MADNIKAENPAIGNISFHNFVQQYKNINSSAVIDVKREVQPEEQMLDLL